VAVLFFVVPALASTPSFGVDIPFTQLFFGRPFRALLDDAPHYPRSYVSVEYSYWDIYYERRGTRLHDYHQNAGLVTAIYRRHAAWLGAAGWRDDLSLEQDNVYTDADRMTGTAYDAGGKAIAGYTFNGGLPLALTRVDAVGAAGSNGEFLADLEMGLAWNRAVEVLLTWETFANELEIDQEIEGTTFPFHFPFETDRWFGRVEIHSPSTYCIRLTGLYETNSGEGDVVQGFENRLWVRRAGMGGTVDYKLKPWYRLDIVPRLTDSSAPGPGVRLRVDYTDIDSDLEMRYNDVRYLHLDGLEGANALARLDVVPLRWLSLFGGWERLQFEHHGDSFFDVWPFTIWDVFSAKRYRLDDMETRLDTWFVGSAGRFERERFTGELSGRFEWWDSEMELDWLERIDVLFPFFFRYERHSESPDLDTEYALQIDAKLEWRFWSSAVRFTARATIPFEEEEQAAGGAPTPPPGSGGGGGSSSGDDSSHGGLLGTVELVIGY
jgi:hypothetical protein